MYASNRAAAAGALLEERPRAVTEAGRADEEAESTGAGPLYVLGQSEPELQRLIDQSRLFNELTELVFRQAGLERGMDVLDLGCGAGDVSLLAARLVGESGTVVGVDRSAEAVAFARRCPEVRAAGNVSFVIGDIGELELDRTLDAVVGRLVLMYQADPAACVRQAAERLRPGGVLVFHEMDLARGCESFPACPLWDACVEWLRETFRRARIDLQAGLRLRRIFQDAGLPAPRMLVNGLVEGGPTSLAYATLAATIRSCLPMIEKLGVATASQVGIETLADRLRREVTDAGAVVVTPTFVGAWARKP